MVPAMQRITATADQRDAPFPPVVLEMTAGVIKLASLLAACTTVMQLVEDQRASAQQIAEVICYDPGLSAPMLKLANCAPHAGAS